MSYLHPDKYISAMVVYKGSTYSDSGGGADALLREGSHALVIKGDFDGLSTGINGGRRQVRSVINHEVGKDFNNDEPLKLLDEVAADVGADTPYFGFLTAVKMRNLCVVRDAYLTAFITAGISNPCHDPGVPGTINVILVIRGTLSEGALGGAIITATEAKAKALFEMGFDFTGTTTDAIAVLADQRPTGDVEAPFYEYCGHGDHAGPQHLPLREKGRRRGHPAPARHRREERAEQPPVRARQRRQRVLLDREA